MLTHSYKNLSVGATAIAIILTVSQSVQALTLVTNRSNLQSNDSVDWSSLGEVSNPLTGQFNFLPFSFPATSVQGLGINVDIQRPNVTTITPPFVFQTLPIPQGIPTNFASGDYILFTGLNPASGFPAVGNDGPLTISFDTPVKGAGTQIAVDDTFTFTAFISAFDNNNNLLGTFEAPGTSSIQLDNSALFLGVQSDIVNIAKLVYSSSVPNTAFGINKLSIVSASVPETSFTLGLLAFGTFGLGSILKRQQK